METEGSTGAEYYKINERFVGENISKSAGKRGVPACKGVMIPAGTGIRDRVTIHADSLFLAKTEAKFASNSKSYRSQQK